MERNIVKMIAIIALAGISGVAGCSDGFATADDSAPNNDASLQSAEAPDLEDLAWRYLYQPLEHKEDAERIFEEIRQLDADEERAFRDLATALQLADVEVTDELLHEIEVGRAVHEQLLRRGISMVDATETEADAALTAAVAQMSQTADPWLFAGTEETAACGKLQVACATTGFNGSVSKINACPVSTTAPYGYDRRENDACATGACDYRFLFSTPTKRSYAKGLNAATNCALWKSSNSLPSNYASGTQAVLVGFGTASACNVLIGTVQSGLRIF